MDLEFWEDSDNKKVKLNLFTEIAKKLADTVASESTTMMNNPTQLRRFFDEILAFDSSFKMAINKASKEEKEEVFRQQLPYVHMLIPKVRYAEGRKLVSANFANMIEQAVENIKKPEDVRVFTTFFEAFIGYFKYFKEIKYGKNVALRADVSNKRR